MNFHKEAYLCSVKQAAKILPVTVGTIRKWITDGWIPCVRIGGRIFIRNDFVQMIKMHGLDTKEEK